MKFSIVTISFNQANFLEEAIQSIANQKNQSEIEYIVVDPGSTDGSLDIIKKYSEEGVIQKTILTPDKGPADGLNKGFSVATGDIYGFLNSDDILEINALSEVNNFFTLNPEIDVVSGDSWIIDESGNKIRRFYSDKFKLWMASHSASIVSQPSTFFRSPLFKRIGGFNIGNKSNWDHELFVDFALGNASFCKVHSVWSSYRVHSGGITGSGKLDNQHKNHRKNMFRKIKKREFTLKDYPEYILAKYLRKAMNIPDTYERLIHGPIYKSHGKNDDKK